ncbi:hypothetical protein [Nocardia sp. NPDC004722]
MDGDGNFYASQFSKRYEFQHSSFFAGGPVAAAGVLEAGSGRLMKMTGESGHYLTEKRHLMQAVDRVHELGAPLPMDRVQFYGAG